jgi:hypothetical protein
MKKSSSIKKKTKRQSTKLINRGNLGYPGKPVNHASLV